MVAYKVVVCQNVSCVFFLGLFFYSPGIQTFFVGSVTLDASWAEVHCRDRGGSPEALRCSPDISRGVVHMLNAMWDDL